MSNGDNLQAVDAQPDAAGDAAIQLQQELPLAFVDGKPVTAIPQDLYIPPDALSVILQAFEGPLDLLLYLIRKQNMDILNIDVSEITRQYMEYIELAEKMKFELAAEYLLMAAMLAEIKSRMLLPKPKTEDGEEIDPRAELIRRLQQYERYKKAAEDIEEIPRLNRDIFEVNPQAQTIKQTDSEPHVSLEDLMLALKSVMERSDHYGSHHIQREVLSTRERMSKILELVTRDTFAPFGHFFSAQEGRAGVVVTFLAMMELIKEQLIELIQAEPMGPIHIRARA